jgi:dTDP-glucose pyrophosphorylase
MKDWKTIVVSPQTPLGEAIQKIDKSGIQLALVMNTDGTLAGVLSDGDVRRAILRAVQLQSPTSEAMNRSPTTAPATASRSDLLALMRRKILHHLPLLDGHGKVVGLATLDELAGVVERPNWVVLMAGGLGSRLMPLTERTPKPMLPVGGKPILENVLEGFAEQGYRRFFLAVNYLADRIQEHFGDGSRWGVEINYLQEDKRLGTAGALSLLPQRPADPFFVMNGDLLTRVRFESLLNFHVEHNAAATMAVREYDFQVPYGVVRMEGPCISAIDEKPIQHFFVNAGIYALSPEMLDEIPADTFFDMPTLFDKLLKSGKTACAYPLREYWLDIGRMEEFERAQKEWGGDEVMP